MRVLIVEGNEGLAREFEEFLADDGHAPVTARIAEAAWERIVIEPPDAVVLDLDLPGGGGMDVLRLEHVRAADIPVIAISGLATESQARECLQLGAWDFMGKPVPLERLGATLARLEPPASSLALDAADVGRRAYRVAVTLPVRVSEYNGTQWEATSVDLSASGIKLQATHPVSPGPAAKLSLPLPDGEERLEVASVLVRADIDGYAFQFVDLGALELRRLNAAVRRLRTAQRGDAAPHVRVLHTIAEAASRSLDTDAMLRIALDALTHLTGHEIASLHLRSTDGGGLVLHGDRGLLPRLREINRTLRVGEGLIGRVAATGEALRVADVNTAPDLLPAARAAVAAEGIQGFACVPIRSRGRVLGTLSLGRRNAQPFTDAEIALLETGASQIGLALDNARLSAETRRQLDAAVPSGAAVFAPDPWR